MLHSAGVTRPVVEVRFRGLRVETDVYDNLSRNLPTVISAYRSGIEVRQIMKRDKNQNPIPSAR